MTELPAFLNRMKGKDMTTPAPVKAKKTKRQDAYTARITVQIPLSPTDPNSYGNAVIAMDKLEASLPAGSKVVFVARGLGKISV